MKNQALFSSKEKVKFCLLQFSFGALRVNIVCPPLLLSTTSSLLLALCPVDSLLNQMTLRCGQTTLNTGFSKYGLCCLIWNLRITKT